MIIDAGHVAGSLTHGTDFLDVYMGLFVFSLV